MKESETLEFKKPIKKFYQVLKLILLVVLRIQKNSLKS